MAKRIIKRLLREELDLIDKDYKLLASFVSQHDSHRYAQVLWDEDWYAQVVDRIRKDWSEFRVYARPKDEADWENIPPILWDDAQILYRWRKNPPRAQRPTAPRVPRAPSR